MAKKMTRFEFANKAKEITKKLAKLPYQKKALKKALEASIEGKEYENAGLLITVEEQREKLYTMSREEILKDASSVISSIAEATLDIDINEKIIEVLKKELDMIDEVISVEDDEE